MRQVRNMPRRMRQMSNMRNMASNVPHTAHQRKRAQRQSQQKATQIKRFPAHLCAPPFSLRADPCSLSLVP